MLTTASYGKRFRSRTIAGPWRRRITGKGLPSDEKSEFSGLVVLDGHFHAGGDGLRADPSRFQKCLGP